MITLVRVDFSFFFVFGMLITDSSHISIDEVKIQTKFHLFDSFIQIIIRIHKNVLMFIDFAKPSAL